jgi:outer membrane receptor protein involved in Fe transport
VSLSNVWEQSVGVYAKEDIPLTQQLRFVGGLRYDRARFEADGAVGTDAILSPKASLIFAAAPDLDLFTNYGEGFHSNDARTVATNPSSGLVRAKGAEIGARGKALDRRLTTSLVFWAMDLDSELTFAQDTGGTEPSGPSRRIGVESDWGYEILSWLHGDLDLNFAQAKFRETGGAVPYAINQYVSGGLMAYSGTGWQGGLRFRDIGNRWGDEARTIPLEAYCIFDALVEYRRAHWGVQLAVDNLVNSSWRDGQEVITSQLRGEPAPVQDVQFTWGNPRTFLASLKYYF